MRNLHQYILLLFFALNHPGLSLGQLKNVALNKPVIASSTNPKHPTKNIVDGIISRTSKWESGNGKAPHTVEIDLQKYYHIAAIKVHTGILEEEKEYTEKNQADGFWSMKNFKVQYWDDANWTDFPKSEVHENRLVSVSFQYSPSITTFKIRLVCDDGEPINIMEIEVLGEEAKDMPPPPIVTQNTSPNISIKEAQKAHIAIKNNPTGKTLKYVGYNQGYYFPKSNVSKWIEYSNVNSVRVWTSLNSFVPENTVEIDSALHSLEEFEKRKAILRKDPENNPFIKWEQLLPLYDQPNYSSTNGMVFNYALDELKRLGTDVVLQIGSTDFKDNWSNKWKQWQRYYALAYYTAKRGNVFMFALQNEPNHRHSGPMKLEQWIMAMQIVSDAIHCAVEDVNKRYNKTLIPKLVGPVTAGQNTDWWAGVVKSIRTNYRGENINNDLLQIFSTHSYNSPAIGYKTRVNNIRNIIQSNHPEGKTLPIVFTEIGRWMNAYLIDKEETMDSPSLFTEWAGIYSYNMKNGAYGMWAFKFANTTSTTYIRGIKSGHHFTWQGKRIVEDAYNNIALNKPVKTSSSSTIAGFITDGDKTDKSTWISDIEKEKWIEIDLLKPYDIGGMAIYTGSSYGVYTGPDRVRNFKVQYFANGSWNDIPQLTLTNNKYTQVFEVLKTPIKTQKIRFISTDEGSIKVREIKVFEKGNSPSEDSNYNISGIQRTGQVVRLFAKGFKDERPLLETDASVLNDDFDHYTSFDSATNTYYVWLVQRGGFTYNLTIDLKDINIPQGNPVIAETVNDKHYGEVTHVWRVPSTQKLTIQLPAQTVMLLTIPKSSLISSQTLASSSAYVMSGMYQKHSFHNEKILKVQLDASQPNNNAVSYAYFDFDKTAAQNADLILLKVKGYTNKTTAPYRIHVYGIRTDKWNSKTLNWNNALLLDDTEALINSAAKEVFIAGEIAFTNKEETHYLDITNLAKKYTAQGFTFVFIRETRQLGDDEDKGYYVNISNQSDNKPELIYWIKNNKD